MRNFAELIMQERDRLSKEEEAITKQIADLQAKLSEIATERKALDAYQAAKEGKPARQARARTARAPRGKKRDQLVALIRDNPNLTRGELIDKLGIRGDKSAEGSLSNALAGLKKAGTITAVDGKYRVA